MEAESDTVVGLFRKNLKYKGKSEKVLIREKQLHAKSQWFVFLYLWRRHKDDLKLDHVSMLQKCAVTRFWFYAFILTGYQNLGTNNKFQASFFNQMDSYECPCKLSLHYPFFTNTNHESHYHSFFVLSLYNSPSSHFAKHTNFMDHFTWDHNSTLLSHMGSLCFCLLTFFIHNLMFESYVCKVKKRKRNITT